MATRKIGDIVATKTSANGFRKYVSLGSLLKPDSNDDSKGPGFVIALDTHINLAGLDQRDGTVFCSVYHPKSAAPAVPSADKPFPRPSRSPEFAGDEDDSPF